MAISVRDIQEKEFATQAKGGYSVEEVDDFLDELAEQMGSLFRENLELKKRAAGLETDLQKAQADAEAARQAAIEAEKRTPEYNEKSYFENLQKSMREAMIGAQRISDETISDAEAKAAKIKEEAQTSANETIQKAQAEAERITGDAQSRLTALNEQYDTLRTAARSFKAEFNNLIEAQTAVLKEKTKLI